MIQQINLLDAIPKKPRSKINLALVLTYNLLFLAALISYSFYSSWQNQQLRTNLNEAKTKLASAKTTYDSLNLGKTQTEKSKDHAKLKIEVDAKTAFLRTLNEASKIDVATIFANQMTALAEDIPNNAWLKQITLSDEGRSIVLTGKAYDEESVLLFINTLNQNPILSKMGINFTIDNILAEKTQTTSSQQQQQQLPQAVSDSQTSTPPGSENLFSFKILTEADHE